MNYTLNAKLPLSPYSMFSVLPVRGSDGEDYPSQAQFRLIGTVVMGEYLVGMRGGDGVFDGYNPFDLYGLAERARGKALPPHLVFAELDQEDPDDACAFLNAYGPLEATDSILPLRAEERTKWARSALQSPVPENHFLSTLGTAPLLPPAPTPQEDFYEYQLTQFWKAQKEFELTLRLQAALNAGTNQAQRIQQVLAAKGMRWNIHSPNQERRLINHAQKKVMEVMNSNLSAMTPRVARRPNSRNVTGVWGCYALLDAMYLMLFLDIAGWSGRIAECEKCGTLFYTAMDRSKYCTPICENRARALRAYHNKKGET